MKNKLDENKKPLTLYPESQTQTGKTGICLVSTDQNPNPRAQYLATNTQKPPIQDPTTKTKKQTKSILNAKLPTIKEAMESARE